MSTIIFHPTRMATHASPRMHATSRNLDLSCEGLAIAEEAMEFIHKLHHAMTPAMHALLKMIPILSLINCAANSLFKIGCSFSSKHQTEKEEIATSVATLIATVVVVTIPISATICLIAASAIELARESHGLATATNNYRKTCRNLQKIEQKIKAAGDITSPEITDLISQRNELIQKKSHLKREAKEKALGTTLAAVTLAGSILCLFPPTLIVGCALLVVSGIAYGCHKYYEYKHNKAKSNWNFFGKRNSCVELNTDVELKQLKHTR